MSYYVCARVCQRNVQQAAHAYRGRSTFGAGSARHKIRDFGMDLRYGTGKLRRTRTIM